MISFDTARDVAEKLRASLAAHTAAQPRHYPGNAIGNKAVPRERDWSQAVPLWREAYRLRNEAHDLDPNHEAPAWEAEAVSHRAMVTFYEQVLSRSTDG